MSWGVVFLLIGAILVVGLVVYYVVDQPEIKNKKGILEKSEQEYLIENGVTISKEYDYSDNYYKNNISWEKSVCVRVIIDNIHAKLVLLSSNGYREILSFSEIIGCEIVVNSQVTGRIGRAVVGGIIGGDAGAIVGAISAKDQIMSYKIVIYKNDVVNPKTELELIKEKKTITDNDYISAVHFAENVNATIKAILNFETSDRDIPEVFRNHTLQKVLIVRGQDKITLIKVVRELQGISLKEANTVVENGVICDGISQDRAMQIADEYRAKGVAVDIVDSEQ